MDRVPLSCDFFFLTIPPTARSLLSFLSLPTRRWTHCHHTQPHGQPGEAHLGDDRILLAVLCCVVGCFYELHKHSSGWLLPQVSGYAEKGELWAPEPVGAGHTASNQGKWQGQGMAFLHTCLSW